MPGLIDNGTGDFTFNIVPSSVEITFDEKCNLACDYCFMSKTSPHYMTADKAILGIEKIFNLTTGKINITFNSGETILRFEDFKKFVEYVYTKHHDRLAANGNVLTTNGLAFTAEHYQFIRNIGIGLNISIDGNQGGHDKHRIKAKDGSGTYSEIIANLRKIGSEIGDKNWLSNQNIMVIMTVCRENFKSIKSDALELINLGFVKLDIFPHMLETYSDDEIAILRDQLLSLKYEIKQLNLQNPKLNINVYWLNRMWSKHCLSKVLLCSDGIFYLLDGINMLPYRQRKTFAIGTAENGINIEKRAKIYYALAKSARQYAPREYRISESTHEITFPVQLYLWCISRKKNFSEYFDSFRKISLLFYEIGCMD